MKQIVVSKLYTWLKKQKADLLNDNPKRDESSQDCRVVDETIPYKRKNPE
jgi:hypothetical protein